jgi:hypothetical protein
MGHLDRELTARNFHNIECTSGTVEYGTVMEQQKTANHVPFLEFKRYQGGSSHVEMKKVRNEVIYHVTFITILMVR